MQNPYLKDLPWIFIFWLLSPIFCWLACHLLAAPGSPVAMRWFSSAKFAVAVLKVITFSSWKQILWVTDHSKLSGLSTYSAEMCKGIPKRMLIVALLGQQNNRTNISIWPTSVYDEGLVVMHGICMKENMQLIHKAICINLPLLIKLSKYQNPVSVCIKCSNIKALLIF